jgi:hypothetical protein
MNDTTRSNLVALAICVAGVGVGLFCFSKAFHSPPSEPAQTSVQKSVPDLDASVSSEDLRRRVEWLEKQEQTDRLAIDHMHDQIHDLEVINRAQCK